MSRHGLVLLAAALEAAWLGLAGLANLRGHIVATIGLLMAAHLLYLAAVAVVLRPVNGPDEAKPSGGGPGITFILLAALMFRLTAWPIYPAFSDDVFRYRWEAVAQAEGLNPYEVRPSDDRVAGIRDTTYPNVVGKDFKAGYGPLTELVERATLAVARLAGPDAFAQAFWFKLPAALAELAAMALVGLLLAALGLPRERLLIYAWTPLPVFEFWVNGHNDALAVAAVAGALWLAAVAGRPRDADGGAARRGAWPLAFLTLGVGIAAKLWPVLLLPLLAWRAGRKALWLPAAALPFALAAIPYWTDVTENARFMTGFVGGWRNNDSLFGLILYASGGRADGAKRVAFAVLALAAAWFAVRTGSLVRAAGQTLAAALLVSANCHPWYLAWLTPALAVEPRGWILLWTGLAPLAYEVVIGWTVLGEWNGVTPWRWLIYGPVFVYWAVCHAMRWRRNPGDGKSVTAGPPR